MGQSNLFKQSASEVGKSERLVDSPIIDVPMSLAKDGRIVVRRDFDLMLTTLQDGGRSPVVRPLIQTPFQEVTAALSPDERWLAYGSDESNTFEIYVRPFPDVNTGHFQVSRGGGAQPVWSRDGRELFFFSLTTGELMGVRVGAGSTWTASPPARILPSGYARGNFAASATYDVSLDGTRFLMIKRKDDASVDGQVAIVVVQNWLEELKRTVPIH